ncbi:MAG: hypothetical protein ACJ79S_08150, partial [Gemmatimonadaceae bacterium]
MRPASLLRVGAVLSLAACAGRTPAPAASPGSANDGPVAIRLFPPHGRTVSFSLNRPAYVAVFEVVPGQGVSLLYPAAYQYDPARPSDAGLNVALLAPFNLGRTFYLASSSRASAARPSFLYAIASESPLDIDEILRRPSELRSRIGVQAFARMLPDELMELIDRAVVPAQPDEAWATDDVVLWPELVAPARVPLYYYTVQCADGRTIYHDPAGGWFDPRCFSPRVERVLPRQPAPTDTSSAGPRNPPPGDSTPGVTPPATPPTEPPARPRQARPSDDRDGRSFPATRSLAVDFGTPRERTATEAGRGERSLRSEPAARAWGGRESPPRAWALPERDGRWNGAAGGGRSAYASPAATA